MRSIQCWLVHTKLPSYSSTPVNAHHPVLAGKHLLKVLQLDVCLPYHGPSHAIVAPLSKRHLRLICEPAGINSSVHVSINRRRRMRLQSHCPKDICDSSANLRASTVACMLAIRVDVECDCSPVVQKTSATHLRTCGHQR